MKYLIRLLTLFLSILAIFVLLIFGVTKKSINVESIKESLQGQYVFEAADDVTIGYLPFPSITFKNATINTTSGNKILQANELKFGFSLISIINLTFSNQTTKNIDRVIIQGGMINIDEFIKFSQNRSLINSIDLNNTLVSNSFFGNLKVYDDKNNRIDQGFGRVNLGLRNSFGSYKFSGYFINDENLSFSGSLSDKIDLSIYGKGVNINIPSSGNFKIDISNFDLINDTILETFPDYITRNLKNHVLKLSGNIDANTKLFNLISIDGTLAKGTGYIRTLSNGLNVSTINLESLSWGKEFADLQNGFFRELLVNFNAQTTKGYAVLAKNLTIHNENYDSLKLLLTSNDKGLYLQDFTITGKKGNLKSNISYNDQTNMATGTLDINLEAGNQLITDALNYAVSYKSVPKLSEEAKFVLKMNFELGKDSYNAKIAQLGIDDIYAAANIKYNNTKTDAFINISNLNLDKLGYSATLNELFKNLFMSNESEPQTSLNALNFIDDSTRYVLNISGLTINSKFIENIVTDFSFAKKSMIINRLVINDDRAKLSLTGLLNNTKKRPSIMVKTNISYLDYNFLNDIVKDDLDEIISADQIWSRKPFSILKWGKFDGKLDIVADRILLGSMPIDSFSTNLEFSDGNMSIGQSKVTIFGGSANFSGYFKEFQNSLTLNINLQNADFDLTENHDSKFFNAFSGPYSLSSSIKTSGTSLMEYVSNLSGNLAIESKAMRINGFDVDSIVATLGKFRDTLTKEIVDVLKIRSAAIGATNIAIPKAEFNIDNGILKISDAPFNTLYSKGKATISYDIPRQSFVLPAQIRFEAIPFKGSSVVNFSLSVSGGLGKYKREFNLDNINYRR